MRWKYFFVSLSDGIYIYEYVRENADTRGIVRFDATTGKGEVIRPCSLDEGYEPDAALSHFFSVVDAGFPEEYSVSCG